VVFDAEELSALCADRLDEAQKVDETFGFKREDKMERCLLAGNTKRSTAISVCEVELSRNIYERGVDGQGFARIRSKGDAALFGGNNTQAMKTRLDVSSARPLADFLPTVTLAAKNLATEMTNHNVKQNDLKGEPSISGEHVQNNRSVRDMLGDRGIKPEELPPEEDLKKLERRVNGTEKKLGKAKGLLKGKKGKSE
jgi:DNA-damage-inducible protein D